MARLLLVGKAEDVQPLTGVASRADWSVSSVASAKELPESSDFQQGRVARIAVSIEVPTGDLDQILTAAASKDPVVPVTVINPSVEVQRKALYNTLKGGSSPS